MRTAVRPQRVEVATLAEVEREHVIEVLRSTGGDKTEAARLLGIDRRTLYRRLEAYGVLDTAKHYEQPVAIQEVEID